MQSIEKANMINSQVIQELWQFHQELKDANTQATAGLEEGIGQSENEYPAEHQLDPITQYWTM